MGDCVVVWHRYGGIIPRLSVAVIPETRSRLHLRIANALGTETDMSSMMDPPPPVMDEHDAPDVIDYNVRRRGGTCKETWDKIPCCSTAACW